MVRKNLPRSISKVTPPRLHRVLRRPRLFDRMEGGRNQKLLLILGQGAQGKSTLAASYLEWSGRPYAWLNLGPEDSDPVNLFLALIHAVRRTLDHIDVDYLASLVSISYGPRDPIPMYRRWATSLYDRIPAGFQIGFDGLDNLSAEASSFSLLQILIEESPADMRLLMMSRSMPPLDINHWQKNHEAMVIDNAEMAFTPEEAKAFFKKIQDVSIKTEQLDAMHQLTEGWIGGLILMCETIRRSGGGFKNIQETGPGFNGVRNKVFQYFSEQVFSTLSGNIQDFLIKTSMFDVVESSITDELLGIGNSDRIIEDLSRQNLFVAFYPVPGKNRIFRYHQLYGDFLRTKFETNLTTPQRRELLLKAARLFEEKEDDENALRFYLEVKEYRRAAVVLERIGLDVLKQGRDGDVERWLTALPHDMVMTSPWLLTYLCINKRFTDAQNNLTDFLKAIDIFKKQGDVQGQLTAMSYLIECMMLLFLFDRDFLDKADALLASTKTTAYPYERSLLMQKIGFAHSLRGNIRLALEACLEANRLAEQIDHLNLQANALNHAIPPLVLLGDFTAIDELAPKLERILNKLKSNELWLFYRVNHCFHLIQRAEPESTLALCRKILEDIEEQGIVYFLPFILLCNLMSCVLAGDGPGAERFSERLKSLSSDQEGNILIDMSDFFMGILAYRNKDYHAAYKAIKKSTEIFASDAGRSESQLNIARITKGLLDYHLHDESLWEDELEAAREYWEQMQSRLYLVQYHWSKALLSWKKNDRSKTVSHLEAGFGDAGKLSYTHFLAISPADVVRVCALAIELEAASALNYAARLLGDCYAGQAAVELDRLSRHRNLSVRKVAKEIKTAIHLKDRPRLRIETLGGFRVRRGRAVMSENDWGGSLPKQLLAVITAHGRRGVPKEKIVDNLWPEKASREAEKNFKFVLHRLRKALEPDMNPSFGSSYVHLKNNMISLTDLVEHIDLEDFFTRAALGEEKERLGDVPGALEFYDRALLLYRGEFFPEDQYQPWLIEKREAIAARYRQVLFNLARLHEARGASKKAISAYNKVIEAEPTLEEAYCRLMRLHFRLGYRNQALNVYRLCQRNLEDILDVEPESETVALYQRIMDET